MAASATATRSFSSELANGVVRLTLRRPEKRNALSHEMLVQLHDELGAIESNTEARVVVIAAEGSVFCAGHDLEQLVGRSEAEYREIFSACSRFMGRLRQIPQPVVARVHGPALAAGCQLVAACDMAVASDNATFSTPGVKIGLFCTTPMVPLVRAIPAKAAMEMLMTGAPISAERALALGLVNRVMPSARLEEAIRELTDAICAASPLTVRMGKAAFYDQLALAETEAYPRASDVMTENALRHDAQEGISAFLQKRRPTWTGE
jgi:enoyl-CoA hydratase/carnithine racemase